MRWRSRAAWSAFGDGPSWGSAGARAGAAFPVLFRVWLRGVGVSRGGREAHAGESILPAPIVTSADALLSGRARA
jgi:hypothetical protein